MMGTRLRVNCLTAFCILVLPWNASTCLGGLPGQAYGGWVEIREVDGRVAGFDVLNATGEVVAPIRFSATGLFWPDTSEQAGSDGCITLRFSDFRCPERAGLALSGDSFISFVWQVGESFPLISFRMSIAGFDAKRWRRSQGEIPFHFLICSVPEAEVFHQRGWLLATPFADPFPLQQAPHAGQPELRSAWSPDWSYAPALGCHPIPVIGLWAAHHNRYVAYDFSETRLADNSEKDVGTVYCWRHGNYRQFIALVFPTSPTTVDRLALPSPGDEVQSYFRLVWSDSLPPTGDPNRFLINRLAKAGQEFLPYVPRLNDLDYMPGPTRLDSFTEPAPRTIIGRGSETRFYQEGTVVIHGWKTHIGSWVDRLFETGREDRIGYLRLQAKRLLETATRFRVDDDPCVYWEKPVEGNMVPAFGGEQATSLHNSDGFAAARCLLDLWKHDQDPRYLEAAEGALNWAKHIVWTRNEFVDVPSCPFAIGGSLPIAFLLDYYHIFRDDPDRSERAQEALDLAVSFAYRYLPVWLYDNNREDALDSAYLLEPNAGRDWAGAACANEVTWQIEAMAEVMLTTGDPVLERILRGVLERWPLLYRDEYQASVADYGSSFTECFGLYPGCRVGTGNRAAYGWAEPFHLLYPVGLTRARVICGEKACFVTNRGGRHTTVEDYRTDGRSVFSFRVVSKLEGPFDMSVSIPRVDLRSLPISRKRDDEQVALTPGREYSVAVERSDSLLLRDVRDGDTYLIGAGDAPARKARQAAPSAAKSWERWGAFNLLRPRETYALPRDWFDTDSVAGLFAGLQYAYGVPFRVESDEWGAPVAWKTRARIDRRAREHDLFVFWVPGDRDSQLLVERLGKKTERLSVSSCAVARRGWPPIFGWRLLVGYIPVEESTFVRSLRVSNGHLVAITSLPSGLAEKAGILARLAGARATWEEELAFESGVVELVKQATGIDWTRLGILPPYSLDGAAARLLFETGILKQAHRLERRELNDRAVLDPRRFPVLLVAGGEEYVHTISREGDAKEALMNYVRTGGSLFICGPGPFPMFYAAGRPGRPSEPFLPQVAVPIISIPDSRPTTGWTIRRAEGEHIFVDLPREFPFPTSGDRRLRPIDRRRIDPSCSYKPLLSVYDKRGKLIGDAAAWLAFTEGPQKGFRVFYIWGPLLKHPGYGTNITLSVISRLVELMKKTGATGGSGS